MTRQTKEDYKECACYVIHVNMQKKLRVTIFRCNILILNKQANFMPIKQTQATNIRN